MMGIDTNSQPTFSNSNSNSNSHSNNTHKTVVPSSSKPGENLFIWAQFLEAKPTPTPSQSSRVNAPQKEVERTTVADLSFKNNTVDNARKTKIEVSKELLAKAIKRLMFDWQQIQKDPLSTVTARPLDSDFFECTSQ